MAARLNRMGPYARIALGDAVKSIETWKLLLQLAIAVGGAILYFRFGEAERAIGLQLKQNEWAIKQATRTPPSHRLEVLPLGRGEDERRHYLLRYCAEVPNQGSSKIELSAVVIEAFQGALPADFRDGALALNSVREGTPIAWNRVYSRGHFYRGDHWKDGMQYTTADGKDKITFIAGGGGTAKLDAGETAECSAEMVVAAQRPQLVSFRTRLHFDGGKSPDDRWNMSRVFVVGDDAPQGTVSSNREPQGSGTRTTIPGGRYFVRRSQRR